MALLVRDNYTTSLSAIWNRFDLFLLYPNKTISLPESLTCWSQVYCIFICLGCQVIFCTMQELEPTPVFPLIVGVSVIALVISMPRFAAISQWISLFLSDNGLIKSMTF
jgi:hypothetical protein